MTAVATAAAPGDDYSMRKRGIVAMLEARRFLLAGLALGLAATPIAAFPVAHSTNEASKTETKVSVEHGRESYAWACASCHGGSLEGGAGPALSGQTFAARGSGH